MTNNQPGQCADYHPADHKLVNALLVHLTPCARQCKINAVITSLTIHRPLNFMHAAMSRCSLVVHAQR